ncbi:uncharacterized protein [Rutidosis leptorrhynchoides]|uniref:uncharacterized protein isoform X3 n=1 Tax=Rutidosis leptorrhynchoides TaxID=125765 RepID=UPI003A9A1D8E
MDHLQDGVNINTWRHHKLHERVDSEDQTISCTLTLAVVFPRSVAFVWHLCEVEVYKYNKHCRVCDKCVNRFGHHCRWLNNCLGKKNY